MAMSLNSFKKLTKEELRNMRLEYESKFDNILSNINTGLTCLRDRFTVMESQFLLTRTMGNNFFKKTVFCS